MKVTITIDDEIHRKLRMIQAGQIASTGNSYSFSSTINEILRRNLNG